MNQELVAKPSFLMPQTFEQAERYAEKIANSSLCPTAFKGKSGDVFICLLMGAEVGLSPMQSVQNIAVINGRPSIWGDALLGIVRSHKHCEYVKEWSEGNIKDDTLTMYCEIKRYGQDPEVRSFSIQQARRAGLWDKQGPWKTYPERMLQMRARGFCARDVFPDALRGLNVAEEVQDYDDVKKPQKLVSKPVKVIDAEKIVEPKPLTIDYSWLDEMLLNISQCATSDELEKVFKAAYKDIVLRKDKEALQKLIEAKDQKKSQINVGEFVGAYDVDTGEVA